MAKRKSRSKDMVVPLRGNFEKMLPKADQPATGERKSAIFKGDAASRIANLNVSGVSAFGKAHRALPSGDMNSPYGLPNMGDSSSVLWTGAPGQGIRGSLINSDDKSGLKIEAMGTNSASVQPFFHTPGNAQDAFNLPKSYVEQIRWSRLMYNLNAYIGAITDLKAYYAYSKFKITTSEPFVSEFYTQVAFNKNFDLYDFALRLSLSKEKFGEALPWGSRKMDGTWPKTGKPRWVWDYFIMLEPELVEIKKSLIGSNKPQFFLRPSRDLEDLVARMDANDAEVAAYSNKIAERIKERIRKRELVPVDPSTISAIQNLTDASATRGTPPYQRLFVTYILEDFIRLAQMAQANRYHFPIELWTLGDLEKNILPNVADLENVRNIVTTAIQSPPAVIFFPPILKYEALGVSGKLLSIKADYDYIQGQYMVGMGVSQEMILGSSGIFSSTETSSNQAFIRGRIKERDTMEAWMTWNFFEPLARWNNLKIKKGSILSPILPTYEWDKVLDYSLEERETETRKYLFEKGKYPSKRLLSKLKENPEEIEMELKAELNTIFDDGKRILAPAIRTAMAAQKGAPAPAPAAGAAGAGTPAKGGEAAAEINKGGGGGGAGGGKAAPEESTGQGGAAKAESGGGGAGGPATATPAETAAIT